MKRMVLGVSMILACLVFLVPPATAATVSHGAPVLSDFLASLTGPAPVSAAKRPALREKSLCAAAANCANGGTVSCSSNTSTSSCTAVDGNCSVGEPGHVTCDGVTTWCSPCFNCDTLEQDCSWSCNPCSYNFSCDPVTQDWSCRCILRGCPQ